MSANRTYWPAYIGGLIKGVQMSIMNKGDTDITAHSTNGVYYTFSGQDYQLLDLTNVTIPAGQTVNVTKELYQQLVPSSDIKIMADIADLVNCQIDVNIAWGV